MTSLANTLQRPLSVLGLDKRLPILVTLCLVVLLAHSLAVLTWKVLPAPVIAPIAPIAAPDGLVNKPPTRATQVHQISEWHLFGDAATAPPPAAKQEFVPETRLNLKLRGVVASSNPQLASAIIADERNAEDTYFVGDALPGEATLREIHPDQVILEYRGRLETLKLVEEEDNAGRRPNVARAAPAQFDPQANVGVNSPELQPSELLAQYRDALINDPQSLMDLVRATPVEDPESGQLKGFRISPGKDRTLLGRFGLRSGDIVTAVNGIPLDNPIKGLEIMQQLSTANAVSLQVDRRGESLNMEFSIQQ